MRKIADGKPFLMPATIEDPAAFASIDKALGKAGFATEGAAQRPDREVW